MTGWPDAINAADVALKAKAADEAAAALARIEIAYAAESLDVRRFEARLALEEIADANGVSLDDLAHGLAAIRRRDLVTLQCQALREARRAARPDRAARLARLARCCHSLRSAA